MDSSRQQQGFCQRCTGFLLESDTPLNDLQDMFDKNLKIAYIEGPITL